MKNVYALFIAIDKYPLAHHRLNGCVNDMRAMKDFVTQRFDEEQAKLHIKVLEDERATREAIVDGFKSHLTQAKEGDLAMFYFSGHGSQEPAHEAFWPWEETRKNQSVVCWDSRQAGGMDLADKELGYLISIVAAGGAEVVAIMDCCHSGSGTRSAGEETKSRQMEDHTGVRALESYLGYDRYKFDPNGKLLEIPNGKHILLAAAHSSETAKETRFEGKPRGVFTYSLIDTLSRARTPLTYQALRERTQTKVYNLAEAQTPQLEVSDTEEVHKLFLDGTMAQATSYHVVSWMKDRESWVIQAGGLHGIPAPGNGEKQPTSFFIFPEGTKESQLGDKDLALGVAKVTGTTAVLSDLEMPSAINNSHDQSYIAVLKQLANPPMKLVIEGDDAGVQKLRAQLEKGSMGRLPGYIQVVDKAEEANFRVISNHGEYKITRPHDGRPLVMKAKGFDTAKTAEDLDHIARWVKTAEVANPDTGFAEFPLKVELLQVVPNSRETIPVPHEKAVFQAKYVHGVWEPKKFKIKFTNTSEDPLYVGILYLSGRYGIQHLPVSVFTSEDLHGNKTSRYEYVRQVQPGESFYALSGGAVTAKLGDDYNGTGITEVANILKLFASDEAFDLTKFERQGDLKLPVPNARTVVDYLDDMLADALAGDWCTKDLLITTVQPLELRPFGYNQPYANFGLTLEGHPNCSGKASLTTAEQAAKGLGRSVFPAPLAGGLDIDEMRLTEGWKADMGLAVLELYELKGDATVSEQSPLVVKFDSFVDNQEQILAVGVDAAGYRVVGCFEAGALRIASLPAPTGTASENLPNSMKIVFLRAVANQEAVIAAINQQQHS